MIFNSDKDAILMRMYTMGYSYTKIIDALGGEIAMVTVKNRVTTLIRCGRLKKRNLN